MSNPIPDYKNFRPLFNELPDYHHYLSRSRDITPFLASMNKLGVSTTAIGLYVKMFLYSEENFEHGFFGFRTAYKEIASVLKINPKTFITYLAELVDAKLILSIPSKRRVFGTVILFNTIYMDNPFYFLKLMSFIGPEFEYEEKN